MVKSVYGSREFYEVACYPHENISKYRDNCVKNMQELYKLGIRYFYSYGDLNLGRVKVLGKGYSSIVTLCCKDSIIGVCKILRLDSRRDELSEEASILRELGMLGIAPKLYDASSRVLFMEYVRGYTLQEYLELAGAKSDVIKVVKRVLEAAGMLDVIGVDHGELSRPGNHVIIKRSLMPCFIDFESASRKRKPRNLTSLASALFFSTGRLSLKLRKIIGHREYQHIRECLMSKIRDYKQGLVSYHEVLTCF